MRLATSIICIVFSNSLNLRLYTEVVHDLSIEQISRPIHRIPVYTKSKSHIVIFGECLIRPILGSKYPITPFPHIKFGNFGLEIHFSDVYGILTKLFWPCVYELALETARKLPVIWDFDQKIT